MRTQPARAVILSLGIAAMFQMNSSLQTREVDLSVPPPWWMPKNVVRRMSPMEHKDEEDEEEEESVLWHARDFREEISLLRAENDMLKKQRKQAQERAVFMQRECQVLSARRIKLEEGEEAHKQSILQIVRLFKLAAAICGKTDTEVQNSVRVGAGLRTELDVLAPSPSVRIIQPPCLPYEKICGAPLCDRVCCVCCAKRETHGKKR